MKLRPTALWRMRISPGPGSPTWTSTIFSSSGPPGRSMRMALLMVGSPSEGAGEGAAVGQHVLAGQVGRMHAAQEGADGAELGGIAEAAGGDRLLARGADRLDVLAGLLGGADHRALQAVGVEGARQQVVEGDAL